MMNLYMLSDLAGKGLVASPMNKKYLFTAAAYWRIVKAAHPWLSINSPASFSGRVEFKLDLCRACRKLVTIEASGLQGWGLLQDCFVLLKGGGLVITYRLRCPQRLPLPSLYRNPVGLSRDFLFLAAPSVVVLSVRQEKRKPARPVSSRNSFSIKIPSRTATVSAQAIVLLGRSEGVSQPGVHLNCDQAFPTMTPIPKSVEASPTHPTFLTMWSGTIFVGSKFSR
ncbi:uncharacterized protein MELLADRAFT_92758 [Melampsora larici-populina 98AG31]|uniref:Uncharacterized protein n=1 Tax=Melampsora larici-populina (strain 98AG31 / pathotype 3-4-7) TaxID=747676 RepID=F4S2M7_MELLP|nr:uncharacterized protein MELLADRAFT_92758 [Melampsora larici-populina 98AG31]EGG01102.1 hypothetical protein MELLADRAFT_92758 [Melampsora larici-populina 98AG31]